MSTLEKEGVLLCFVERQVLILRNVLYQRDAIYLPVTNAQVLSRAEPASTESSMTRIRPENGSHDLGVL